MRSILFLAYKYISHNYLKTIVLTVCLLLTTVVPLAAYFIINAYEQHFEERAHGITLIAGHRGNDYDILLRSLYYKGAYPGSLSMQDFADVQHAGQAIPMYLPFTGHKLYAAQEQNVYYENVPIVGTRLDYFSMRNIKLTKGRWPVIWGEAVVGSQVARRMNIRIGDFVLSDQKNLYDITASYPLKMKVVGILQRTHSPDDDVIFVDIKTTWIIEGIFHGHDDLSDKVQKNVVVSKAKIHEYPEITPQNLHLFHHHGKAKDLPVTAILILAKDHKSKTILLGDYQGNERVTLIQPLKVITRLMSLVLRVHAFFEAYFVLVIFTVVLFIILVVMLSLRLRTEEFSILYKMGCRKQTLYAMVFMEFFLVFVFSMVLSVICVALFEWMIPPRYILQLFAG
ncbi:FtsX-like permease family protein [Candidatus Uabimicrobium amorphum]|uniref:Permease n=1 Tax=Uabimicrobium amorphum TaxID=2596890 RepID=A0A5S9IU59_UABAM|nr:ABC transporter permease [Candidatus Uabimicrobium amorphum]BBM87686.1 permease [Candidatus Uabimicrobium amorphum]